MPNRCARDPSKPLHPHNDDNTFCAVCGKRWIAYLACEAKGCRPVHVEQPVQPTHQRLTGRWATLEDLKP